MGLSKIISWAFVVGCIMLTFQILLVKGHLDATEINIFGATESTAPVKVGAFYDSVKLLLEIPINFHKETVILKPENSSFFTGVQGLTGATEEGFLSFILYSTTFFYFFILTTLFGKTSTIFYIERDQKIFFFFLCILYFILISVLGNL